jgi:hypothetical protein
MELSRRGCKVKTELEPIRCECFTWGCADWAAQINGNGHHPGCEHFRSDFSLSPTAHLCGRDLDNGCKVSFDIGDATKIALRDKSVDLVFGSPPYLGARSYGIDAQRGLHEWLDFMMLATVEGLRVSRGLVIWVVAGTTKNGSYIPGPEALMVAAFRAGIELYRPACWYKVDPETNGGCGSPGSGGKQWLRSDWEYILAFKPQGKLPFADPLFERRPCKYEPGGKVRTRQDGRKPRTTRIQEPLFRQSRQRGQGQGRRRAHGGQ